MKKQFGVINTLKDDEIARRMQKEFNNKMKEKFKKIMKKLKI